MSDTAEVISIHPDAQLVLDGFPEPTGTFFSLQSVKNLPTDQRLRWQQHVSGRFEGTVSGYSMVGRQGEPVQVFTIAVTEAELDRIHG